MKAVTFSLLTGCLFLGAPRSVYPQALGVSPAGKESTFEPHKLVGREIKMPKETIDPEAAGEKQALADLRVGRPRWLIAGCPSSLTWKFVAALAERYGVKPVMVEDGPDDRARMMFEYGYNRAVRRSLEMKFGSDVIAVTEEEFFPTKKPSHAKPAGNASVGK